MTLAVRLASTLTYDTPLCTLFYHASPFASLASVVYVGWDLMVRYLLLRGLLASARTIWIFLPAFKYFFCDLSQDKVYQSPQTRPTPDMVRHSISQMHHSFFRYPPFFLHRFHNAQLRHMSQLLRMNNSNGWHLRGL